MSVYGKRVVIRGALRERSATPRTPDRTCAPPASLSLSLSLSLCLSVPLVPPSPSLPPVFLSPPASPSPGGHRWPHLLTIMRVSVSVRAIEAEIDRRKEGERGRTDGISSRSPGCRQRITLRLTASLPRLSSLSLSFVHRSSSSAAAFVRQHVCANRGSHMPVLTGSVACMAVRLLF